MAAFPWTLKGQMCFIRIHRMKRKWRVGKTPFPGRCIAIMANGSAAITATVPVWIQNYSLQQEKAEFTKHQQL
jgi:hypothetical protein